jgi:hypothetical protein
VPAAVPVYHTARERVEAGAALEEVAEAAIDDDPELHAAPGTRPHTARVRKSKSHGARPSVV